MDGKPTAGPIEWLQKQAMWIITMLALLALAIIVWKESPVTPALTPSPAPTPASTVPTEAPTQWAQLTGPFDGRINALAVEDPDGMRVLYVGTEGGVFRSFDQGLTWQACNLGLSSRLVRALVLDPDDPNVLYAGTWNGKVHLSVDAGQSWQEFSRSPSPLEVRTLAVDTHNPMRLYAGSLIGLFATNNRGLDWQMVFTGAIQCMALDPANPSTLYVGTAGNGVYKSADSGASWFSVSTVFLPGRTDTLTDVVSLAIPPRADRTVYAVSGGRVYKTENGGVFWTYADSYRDDVVARCVAVDPRNAQVVYVGLQDGLVKSEDGRLSWFRSEAGLRREGERIEVHTLVVDPLDSNVLYALATVTEEAIGPGTSGPSHGQLFVSTDAGRTWQPRPSVPAANDAVILALKADPKDGRTFYASVAGGGVYKTTDGGEQWYHVGEPLPAAWVTTLEVNPVDTQVVYIGIWEGFVFQSRDGGTTWAPSGVVTEAQISALAVDPEQPDRIYAGTLGKGLYRSDNQGWDWTPIGDDIGREVQRIVIDPRGPETTVYALTENGVFRSRDTGQTWQPYLSPVIDIAPSRKGGPFTPIVVPRSDPGYVTGQGRTESVVVSLSQLPAEAQPRMLATSAAMPDSFYLLAQGEGVLEFRDVGQSGTPLGAGLEGLQLRALAISPDDPQLILVGTDSGIYRYQPAER